MTEQPLYQGTARTDREALERCVGHVVGTYRSLRRLEAVTTVGEETLGQAERLLTLTVESYLRSGGTELPTTAPVSTPSEGQDAWQELSASYVDLQRAYEDLKLSLYRIAENSIEKEDLVSAARVVSALLEIDHGYSRPYRDMMNRIMNDLSWTWGRHTEDSDFEGFSRDRTEVWRTVSELVQIFSHEPSLPAMILAHLPTLHAPSTYEFDFYLDIVASLFPVMSTDSSFIRCKTAIDERRAELRRSLGNPITAEEEMKRSWQAVLGRVHALCEQKP